MFKKFDTVSDFLSHFNLTVGDKLIYRQKTHQPITAIITAVYPANKCVGFGPAYFSLEQLFDEYNFYDPKQKKWVLFGYEVDGKTEGKINLPCFRANQDYYMQRDGEVEENLFFHVNSLVEIDGEEFVRFLGQDYRILHDDKGEYIKIDAHYSVHAYDICNEASDLDDEPEDEDDPIGDFIDEAIECLDSICKQLKKH